jgi:amino acid transporter
VGVDRLLPAAFGRAHPRWGTPHVALVTLGVIASGLLIAIQIGDTMRAAYQELVSLMVIVGFLPYVYIFGSAWKAGKRVSAVSGWAITLLAIVCAVIPTADVTNVFLFEGKLVGGTLGVIAVSWWLYRRAGNQ